MLWSKFDCMGFTIRRSNQEAYSGSNRKASALALMEIGYFASAAALRRFSKMAKCQIPRARGASMTKIKIGTAGNDALTGDANDTNIILGLAGDDILTGGDSRISSSAAQATTPSSGVPVRRP